MNLFPLEKYLERIGLKGPPKPTEEGLRELHRAQCFHLPFENIDPFLQRGVSLETNSLIKKLLEERRGGYCQPIERARTNVSRNGRVCQEIRSLNYWGGRP